MRFQKLHSLLCGGAVKGEGRNPADQIFGQVHGRCHKPRVPGMHGKARKQSAEFLSRGRFPEAAGRSLFQKNQSGNRAAFVDITSGGPCIGGAPARPDSVFLSEDRPVSVEEPAEAGPAPELCLGGFSDAGGPDKLKAPRCGPKQGRMEAYLSLLHQQFFQSYVVKAVGKFTDAGCSLFQIVDVNRFF